jgi:hypothetical protein
MEGFDRCRSSAGSTVGVRQPEPVCIRFISARAGARFGLAAEDLRHLEPGSSRGARSNAGAPIRQLRLAEQTVGTCGRRGDECVDCGAGFACVNGMCVVDTGVCSAASCPSGCCAGTACIQAADQDWSACGAEGAPCQQCSYGVQCSAGACTSQLATDAYFYVRVQLVTVTERNAGGDNWDVFGGLPDPFVCAGPEGNSGCTSACSDTTACALSSTDGIIRDSSNNPIAFTGADLARGLPLRVYDDDVDAADLVGSGAMPVSSLQPSYSTGPFSQVTELIFEVY